MMDARRNTAISRREDRSSGGAAVAWGTGVVLTGLLGVGLFRLYRWVEENHEIDVTGYDNGEPVKYRVVKIDGKPVEVDTAIAFKDMRAYAARADGIKLHVVSGFRTMEEQRYFYNCYKTCSCNNCNFAERPGYSKHQNGRALDLNTADEGVYQWLRRRASWFGFEETVTDEPWHWEYIL